MNSSDLFLFIGRCLAMDNHPELKETVRTMIMEGTIPWEEFVWTGSSHFVLPALYSAFRRNGLLPLLPGELSAHMEQIHSLNYRRNLGILDQCREIGSLLNHKGIELLFLKGAGVLLSGIYRDLGDRIMEDIDILIREEDLQKAVENLSLLGYLHEETSSGEESYEDHHHLPPLVCRGKAVPVEIHRFPVHFDYSGQVSVQKMFENRLPGKEFTCWLPSFADCQLVVFFHELRAARGYLSQTPSIKGMYDFYLLSGYSRPDPLSLPKGRYRKIYRRFIFITGKYFNDPEIFGNLGDLADEGFWKREVFLLNHSGWDTFWHNYVYASVRFCGLLLKAIYSNGSRRLLHLKMKKAMNSYQGK